MYINKLTAAGLALASVTMSTTSPRLTTYQTLAGAAPTQQISYNQEMSSPLTNANHLYLSRRHRCQGPRPRLCGRKVPRQRRQRTLLQAVPRQGRRLLQARVVDQGRSFTHDD